MAEGSAWHTKGDLLALMLIQVSIFMLLPLVVSPWLYIGSYLLPIATLTAGVEAVRSFSEHTLPGKVPTSFPEECWLY